MCCKATRQDGFQTLTRDVKNCTATKLESFELEPCDLKDLSLLFGFQLSSSQSVVEKKLPRDANCLAIQMLHVSGHHGSE